MSSSKLVNIESQGKQCDLFGIYQQNVGYKPINITGGSLVSKGRLLAPWLDGWLVLGNSINGFVAVVCLKTKKYLQLAF